MPCWPFTDFDNPPDDPRSIAAFNAYQQACERHDAANSMHSDLQAQARGLSAQGERFKMLQEQYMAAGRDMSVAWDGVLAAKEVYAAAFWDYWRGRGVPCGANDDKVVLHGVVSNAGPKA